MKNYCYCLYVIYIFVFITGCNQRETSKLNNSENCFFDSTDTAFESNFYPFSETKYKTSDIFKYFKQPVKIDSGFNKNSNGDTVLYYKYYDDKSQFIFSLNTYNRNELDFDVAVFKIRSTLMEFRNGIKYAMTRKDFFNAIKFKEVNSDTFCIYQGYKGCYFKFIFKNDTLRQLSKEYIQM